MRTIAVIVIAMFVSFAVASLSEIDAAHIRREIDQKGPREVARELFADKSSWATVTKNVRKGKGEWVQIAFRLRSGSDGGASSELQDALFASLANNPRATLQSAGDPLPVRLLCGGRSEPLSTAESALSEIAEIERSVAKVHDKDLREKRKDCLKGLEEAKVNTNRFFKN